MFTGFGALALVLAAVGLYSVIAYNVTQRKHELGVRLALGAPRTGIVRLVVTEGVRVALAGVVIGGDRGGCRLDGGLARCSSGSRRATPWSSRSSAVVLVGVAMVASCIPALRAARVDPRTALLAD